MAFSERYTIEVPLGENELGTVWRGRATEGGAKVAIVVLEADAPEAAQARFREHATKLLGVHSPHVVKAIETGANEEGAPFLVLELLEGESLATRLTSGPALTVARAVEIVTQIGEGLSAVHAAGISHGDVEPGNVFLAKWGDAEIPKLIGFALNRADRRASRDVAARLSLPSLGPQWAYAAPEQVRGETVASVTGDVYSLAAVLFATLGGQPPHVAPDAVTLLESIERGKPATLAALKKELAPFSTVVDRALSTAPDKRPGDMTAFLRGLKTAVAFAKAAHGLALPVGPRSPIGTPVAAAPKTAAAMPKPAAARVAMAKPGAAAKVAVAKPGAATSEGDGAGAAPRAAADATTKDSTTESIEDGSVDLESVRPPPPPPPKPRAAAAEGADLGDIAIDTDDDVPSAAAATATGSAVATTAPATAAATVTEAAPAGAAVVAKPATTAGAEPEPEHGSDAGAATTDQAPSTTDAPSAAMAATASAEQGAASDERADAAAPAAVATSGPDAAPAAAQAADSPAPSAPVAADAPKPAPAAPAETKASEGASSAPERPSQRPPKKKRDSVRPKPPSGWANADAPTGAASAAGTSEAAAKPSKRQDDAVVALASEGPLPVEAARAPARPAWVLPAVGAALLLGTALAFFVLRGGDEPADRPRPSEPEPSTVATGAGELDEAPAPSEDPDPAVEPGVAVAPSDEGDPGAPLAADPAPVEGAETDPSWELGASEEEPPVDEEPVVAAAAEPTPEPEPAAAPPPRTGSGSTTARGSSGSSSGSSGGSTRRTPRTPRTARDRPTVVADPGF